VLIHRSLTLGGRLKRIDALFNQAKVFYENGDPAHDLAHIVRVMDNCRRLGPPEGADLEILLAAAILHDVVNLPKNHPDRLKASAMAAQKSRELLRLAKFSEDEIERIGQVIVEHSYSLGKKPSSVESAVLQDADKLDAVGAIGIMRTITCGTRMGSSFYSLKEPFPETRPLEDRLYLLDHFYVKTLKLWELMNTEAGKKEAKERTAFMHAFLAQLKSELHSS